MDPQLAIPGRTYTCGGCGASYVAPMDAVACCSNDPARPQTAPVDATKSSEDALEEDAIQGN